MSSPVEDIEVLCPACDVLYTDWHRRSLNLDLDNFDEAYIEEASTATCPDCGHRVELDLLIVRMDGVWATSEEESF